MGNFKKIKANIIALGFLQLFNYAYPFLFYPFITKALGPEKFGLISFFTAYVAYFIIVIDYGFNLTATQNIALNRDDKSAIQEIYNNVISTKIVLFLCCFIVFTISLFVIPEFKGEKILCFIIFSGIVSNVMVPFWFFQGIEKMKLITILNIIPKILVIPIVIFFIKTPDDYLLFAIISSSAMIISGFISTLILKLRYSIDFCFSSFYNINRELRVGFDIFLAGALTSFYTVTAIFALGLFSDKGDVGFYSLAEKIVKVLGTIFVPVVNAIYPFLVRFSSNNKRTRSLNNKILFVSTFIMSLVSLALYFYSGPIVHFFAGDGFSTSSQLLKILSPFPLIITIARHLSINYLMVNGCKRDLLNIYAATAFFSIVLFSIMIPDYGSIGTAYAIIIIETLATTLMAVKCYKKRLFNAR
uniref:oligosaccharide flippase family protein n=1 Tax=Citrobacter freundii TaxID=546 RepID=UPI00129CE424|nr:oligosaccharide flippase family protein [Citrobacter freundii]